MTNLKPPVNELRLRQWVSCERGYPEGHIHGIQRDVITNIRTKRRLRAALDALLEEHLDLLGDDETVSETVEEAYNALIEAEQGHRPAHQIILDCDRFDEFVELLDRPDEPSPKLVELFNRPSPWDSHSNS